MSTDLHVERTTDHEREIEPGAPTEPVATSSGEDEETNVFRVLGGQARTRSIAQLWVAFVGGAVDAGLIWWRHPMLIWLAAGCAAVAAYGAWGLLDRAIEARSTNEADLAHALDGLRDLTAIAGTAAALWAVLSFMAVAIGNWNH